jgi:hypothetical protein
MTTVFEKCIVLNSVDVEKLSFSLINNSKFFLKSIKKSKLYYLHLPNSISWRLNESKLFFSSFFYKEALQFLRLFQTWLKKQEVIIKKKLILKGLGFRINFDDKLNALNLKIGYSHLVNIFLPKEKINLKIQKNSIILESTDNIILGNLCNIIKNCRPIDVYKAKGFFFRNDKVKLKPIKKK